MLRPKPSEDNCLLSKEVASVSTVHDRELELEMSKLAEKLGLSFTASLFVHPNRVCTS